MLRWLCALAFTSLSISACAKELVIGLQAAITSLDPHYHNLGPNNGMARHIFDTLVTTDEKQNLRPGLAESWRALDDTTWEFKLRKGVKFHDGSDFTAEDVKFSFERIPKVPNSPSPFTGFVKPVTELAIKDTHTVHFKMDAPRPIFPNELASVFIVSKKAAQTASTDDFNAGRAAIGTGAYRFSEYVAGDRVVLINNYKYWGAIEPWDKVTFKMLTNSASRVAALLSGDVQLIESVPTSDVASLEKNPKVSLASTVSNRLIFLHLDSGRDKNSPTLRDKSGKALENANPLRDARVRKAISKAINREAVVQRLMENKAVVASQFMPDFFFGTVKGMKPDKFDPEAAKKLLADAGYPSGFQLTLHGPNNRYINDEKIAQAVAQMLSRVGIDTKVETMPSNVYFTRASKLEFSLMLVGWGADSGENSNPLRALVHTFDQAKGLGSANRGRYSNVELDKLIQQAISTIDDKKREALLQQATRVAIDDMGIVPLHYEMSVWGSTKGIVYTPRTDQYTLAMSARPGK